MMEYNDIPKRDKEKYEQWREEAKLAGCQIVDYTRFHRKKIDAAWGHFGSFVVGFLVAVLLVIL